LVTSYYMILIPVVVLTVLGLVMTMSAHTVVALNQGESPYRAGLTQAAYAVAGAVCGGILAHTHKLLGRWVAWGALIAALVAQGLVLFTPLGLDQYGNRNWLRIAGQLTVQPSEFVKFGLALWLGSVLANKWQTLKRWSDLALPGLVGIAVAVASVMAGSDAGTALVLGVMSLGALTLAGVPWSKLVTVFVSALLAGLAAVMASPHRRERIALALDPDSCRDSTDACYQILQARYSMASGGWFGSGLGASRAKWAYLSQADSDFIYAIIGEETGLLGALTVLILFGVLGFGLFQVVRLHPDRSVQIAVGGIACWIEGQALINVGMVIKVLPVIGVPLPFVSSGGSALVACLAAIGVVFGLMRTDPEVASALAWRSRRSRRVAAILPATSLTAPAGATPSPGGVAANVVRGSAVRGAAASGAANAMRGPATRGGAGNGAANVMRGSATRVGGAAGNGATNVMRAPATRAGAGNGATNAMRPPATRGGAGNGATNAMRGPATRGGGGGSSAANVERGSASRDGAPDTAASVTRGGAGGGPDGIGQGKKRRTNGAAPDRGTTR
jgi:cell division protein FtsW